MPFTEKTEQPTPRRLEQAIKRGQFPRSSEVQTVVVMMGGLMALVFTGNETWRQLTGAFTGTLGHLGQIPITFDVMQGYCINGLLVFGRCAGPVVVATLLGGLLAGGLQSRFQTASEALEIRWDRINPGPGFQRLFSVRSLVPSVVNLTKLVVILALTYGQVRSVLNDPIFYTPISGARFARFIADTSFAITLRVCLVLLLIAALDYAYQWWRNNQDLMMSKQEVRDETKNAEGNPQVKSRLRRRLQRFTQRRMFLEVPKADVVVTNPTHLAIALRYDRKTMRAPRIVAKGSRLLAQRIREIAGENQVPIVENKPLARLMFKYGQVGGEIPAQLYAAVAEILAWVYRTNRYRYYTEGNQTALP